MNRILRRTILKSLSEQDREDGLLSGPELLVWAPKNLVVTISELTATCQLLQQRRRIQMHDLSGVRGVFIADLTAAGRQACLELNRDESLTLDILWILEEIRGDRLKLYWGARDGALVLDVTATLAQLLLVRNGMRLRRALQTLHNEGLVELKRDSEGRCVQLSIKKRGTTELRARLARL